MEMAMMMRREGKGERKGREDVYLARGRREGGKRDDLCRDARDI